MWGILQTVLISIIIITIGQYSFQYLKDTLTPRKTKDLVGFHKQKFDEIINELKEAKNNVKERFGIRIIRVCTTTTETRRR